MFLISFLTCIKATEGVANNLSSTYSRLRFLASSCLSLMIAHDNLTSNFVNGKRSIVVNGAQLKGEYVGIREARKHASWYIKGLRGAAQLRNKVNTATSLKEMNSILSELL